MILLLDADAFLCLRKVSLLRCLAADSRVGMVMTSYIATHELKDVAEEVAELRQSGKLTICSVKTKTKEYRSYEEFKESGHDPGESEAVAWAVSNRTDDLYFTSQDRRARTLARKKKIPQGNVADLGAKLEEGGFLPDGRIRELFEPCYQDPNNCGHGCPGGKNVQFNGAS